MFVFVQVVFLIIHVSLVFHGRQVVSSAAQEALHVAQLNDGNQGAGEAAGDDVFAISNSVSGSVSVSRGTDTVSATATGTIDTTLLPFANTVSVTVQGPVEEFRSEADRQ